MRRYVNIRNLIIAALACSACTACRDENTTTLPPAPAAAAAALDLEATMNGYVVTVQQEHDILSILLDPEREVTSDDADAYWALLQKRIAHADEIDAMIRAEQRLMPSVCGWYDSELREPWLDVVRLRNRISERDRDKAGRSAHAQLLLDGAGSPEAARAHVRMMSEHAASPTNLHIMCIKAGYIKDD